MLHIDLLHLIQAYPFKITYFFVYTFIKNRIKVLTVQGLVSGSLNPQTEGQYYSFKRYLLFYLNKLN